MIVGYLSKNYEILDINGNFIKYYRLGDDEKIISTDENLLVGGIGKGWKRISSTKDSPKFDGGKGILIETNKRLIFYKEVNPMEKMCHHLFTSIEAYTDVIHARRVKAHKLKEYFEFDIDEIKHVKTYKFSLWLLCIISDGEQYSIGIPRKSEVLKDFLSKIPNYD